MEFLFLVAVIGGSIYYAWFVPEGVVLQLPLLGFAEFFLFLILFFLCIYLMCLLTGYIYERKEKILQFRRYKLAKKELAFSPELQEIIRQKNHLKRELLDFNHQIIRFKLRYKIDCDIIPRCPYCGTRGKE